jgi:electron transport complex protein RnfA
VTEFIVIIIAAALANNFVLIQFLGVTSVLAIPLGPQLRPAALMSMASGLLIITSTVINHLIYYYGLLPSGTPYLRLVAFMLTSTLLASVIDAFWRRLSATSHKQIRGTIAIMALNTCVLGSALISLNQEASFAQMLALATGAAIGFGIVLILVSAMRLRLQTTAVPKPFRGAAITLVSMGLLALGFLGFAGIV